MKTCAKALLIGYLLIAASGREAKAEIGLFQAVRNNDLSRLKSAASDRATVNVRGARDVTPLMHAAAFGSVEAVEHETGKLLGTARTNASCLPLTNKSGDAVYLVGMDGRILCARSSTGPYLRNREVNVAADRLNIAPRVAEEAPVELPKEKAPDPADEDPLRSRRDVRP